MVRKMRAGTVVVAQEGKAGLVGMNGSETASYRRYALDDLVLDGDKLQQLAKHFRVRKPF